MRRRRRLHQGSLRVPASETPLLGGEPPRAAEHEPESTQHDTAEDKKKHAIVRWYEADALPDIRVNLQANQIRARGCALACRHLHKDTVRE
jgi:hypothetical protein